MGRMTVRGSVVSQRDINRLLELSDENQFGANNAYYKLKHYEDLEEQGRLIELPCKVGDTVWSTRWWDNKKISKKIDGETWYKDIFQHKITKEKFSLYDLDKIGKDVFLTKEEAEEKLKRLQENYQAL